MHEKPHELRVKTSGFIMQVEVLDTNMGKKRDFTDADRLKIMSMLGYGKSTLEIAKNMNRDHRTIERFAVSGQTTRKTPKRCHLRRLSPRDIRKLKVEMATMQRVNQFFTTLAPKKERKQPDAKP